MGKAWAGLCCWEGDTALSVSLGLTIGCPELLFRLLSYMRPEMAPNSQVGLLARCLTAARL